jgi:hypothetical protein
MTGCGEKTVRTVHLALYTALLYATLHSTLYLRCSFVSTVYVVVCYGPKLTPGFQILRNCCHCISGQL